MKEKDLANTDLPETGERLQKILAAAGAASRRAAEEMIRAGRVTVDGKVAQLGGRAGPNHEVCLDGRPVLRRSSEHITYMLYKPRGIVTTAHDELGRQAVLDLMPRTAGLHSVGRLDRDSEGLLLLTTDGDLTLKLTHPRYDHQKEYRVWVDGEITKAAVKALRSGVDLEDGISKPTDIQPAEGGLYITIGEGRNRQIRRTLEALDLPVTRLLRVRMGDLWLGDLEPGEYHQLNNKGLERVLSTKTPNALERDETRQRWG
jgi:23S rRNA pseudouridine2605 synthase